LKNLKPDPLDIAPLDIAMTSIRMEPVWMALGEAAGVAASIALKARCRRPVR